MLQRTIHTYNGNTKIEAIDLCSRGWRNWHGSGKANSSGSDELETRFIEEAVFDMCT